jgi:hypothetical protein
MAENRAELVFPFGGLNDAEALTDQPNATTTEAVNVRPFDPVTGRRRGAQRAGLSRFNATALEDGRVQALVPVSYAENRLKYSLLGTPTQEWAEVTPAQGTATAITVDSNGYIYVFDGETSIVKYNPDGTRLKTLALGAAVMIGTTRRLVVDEFGAVYAGIVGDSTSQIQRWSLTEDDEYLLSWMLPVSGELRDFSVRNGLLYATTDSGVYLEEGASSALRVYSGLESDYTPVPIWEKSVPHPVHGIQVTSSGKVYFTSAPNPTRGDVGSDIGTFNESYVDWNLTEIANANERIHYWIDVSHLATTNPEIDHETRIGTPQTTIYTPDVRADYSEDYERSDKTGYLCCMGWRLGF